jgi:hypothetical protein
MKIALILLVFLVPLGFYVYKENGDKPLTATTTPTEIVQETRDVAQPVVQVTPTKIIQGDPVFIKISEVEESDVKSLMFNGKALSIIENDGQLGALAGIDLRGEIGSFPVTLTLNDGTIIKSNLVVGERIIAKAPLGIPDKLGGNTEESEKELINTLVQEGNLINSIPSTNTQLWSGDFRYPLNGEITITDVYGYSRITGGSTFSHKGTDFRAAVGTPIYAMNDGRVAYTGYLRNYGNTIVLDHGLGLQTIYMHLSEVSVAKGDDIKKGEQIGKTGDTGYVLGPHLHLSIKIDHISIDPLKFLELF